MKNGCIMSVSNLECAYRNSQVVLRVDQLEIPRGKLVFIIGKSGVGKSTFIETLGIMNNTIVNKEDSSILLADGSNTMKELKSCWQWSNEKLSALRRRHFSFIFQNTNLMPGFSSGENMAVSMLLRGSSFTEAKEYVLSVMDRLSLDRHIFDKKVTEISGGQRQRLAFVRAVTSEYSILFGDEPTGNLDSATASELITILKEIVRDNNKTAVLVSHDLNLAIRFADVIIPIIPAVEYESYRTYGWISLGNTLLKTDSNWTDSGRVPVSSPLELLTNYLR